MSQNLGLEFLQKVIMLVTNWSKQTLHGCDHQLILRGRLGRVKARSIFLPQAHQMANPLVRIRVMGFVTQVCYHEIYESLCHSVLPIIIV